MNAKRLAIERQMGCCDMSVPQFRDALTHTHSIEVLTDPVSAVPVKNDIEQEMVTTWLRDNGFVVLHSTNQQVLYC